MAIRLLSNVIAIRLLSKNKNAGSNAGFFSCPFALICKGFSSLMIFATLISMYYHDEIRFLYVYRIFVCEAYSQSFGFFDALFTSCSQDIKGIGDDFHI